MSFNQIEHQVKLHATLLGVGTMVILPIGILIPRFARSFTDKWFYFHFVFQFVIAGPLIMAGFAYGYKAVQNTINEGSSSSHFSDQHMHIGLLIFILYFVQLTLGVFSHFVKIPSNRYTLYRSPQQYLHIGLGLAIIGMSFFQVRLGYTYEWIYYIATFPPNSVHRAWLAMAILIPTLYGLGLAFLPRQLSREARRREERGMRKEVI